MSEKHLTDTRFDSFDLDGRLTQGIEEAGFSKCTPIQAETLPVALKGQDVAGQAQTGTGKTAAFLLTTFQHLISNPADEHRKPNQPRALILAPTRELAVQIHKDAELLGKHLDFRRGLVFGGTGYEQQRKQLEEGVDILIGTPGRLIDYFKQHVYNLKAAQVVVLDEADRMFDLGFIKDIRYLLRRCPDPDKRLGLLFSATLSYRVTELAYEHMNNPETIVIEADKVTADKVHQSYYMTANDEKVPLLIGLMRKLDPPRSIVFVNTKRTADRIWGFLEGNGLKAAILSGDVPQKKRLSLLKQFQSGELPILVATDVAARGLHIPDVSHVFNYDLPEDAEDYVHRIGRTARAGASGDAISFACETYAFSLPDIEQYIGHSLPMEPIRDELLAEVDPNSRVRTERRKPRDHKGKKRHGGGHHKKHHGEKGSKKEGESRSGGGHKKKHRH
ncbi:ATP-dependent RNA helicase RhlB [Solemya velesiana gill symbiont]|uniref:ATP-dependent RNA helicase RhlB n=1 Tax=Solemya velesiana gill symbiont TaxID=1918948 RepID=A0A1T2KWK1_9GAMM|nr:ATP-dependent RNA helicase RhlB [Solemya velesiana gill symbiont]OOZ37130.1 RNA helicase [Solemya velesiana gill symbiont]